MRVAVAFFGSSRSRAISAIAEGLKAGIESQGHQVDLIDWDRAVDVRLTVYEYVAIGCPVVSPFGGKIPEVQERLSAARIMTGRKAFVFVPRAVFGATRALRRMMDAVEREGVFLRFSEVLRSVDEARAVGARLKIGS